MRRPAAALGRFLITTLILITAIACAGGRDGGGQGFRSLDEAVTAVNPSSIGEVAYDGTSGSRQPFTQGPTRYLLVFAAGDRQTVLHAVERRLAAAGFGELNSTSWRRVTGSATVLVYVQLYDSGQKAPKGLTVPAGHTGIWFNFNTGT
jgi:hypothetical protein